MNTREALTAFLHKAHDFDPGEFPCMTCGSEADALIEAGWSLAPFEPKVDELTRFLVHVSTCASGGDRHLGHEIAPERCDCGLRAALDEGHSERTCAWGNCGHAASSHTPDHGCWEDDCMCEAT